MAENHWITAAYLWRWLPGPYSLQAEKLSGRASLPRRQTWRWVTRPSGWTTSTSTPRPTPWPTTFCRCLGRKNCLWLLKFNEPTKFLWSFTIIFYFFVPYLHWALLHKYINYLGNPLGKNTFRCCYENNATNFHLDCMRALCLRWVKSTIKVLFALCLAPD